MKIYSQRLDLNYTANQPRTIALHRKAIHLLRKGGALIMFEVSVGRFLMIYTVVSTKIFRFDSLKSAVTQEYLRSETR